MLFGKRFKILRDIFFYVTKVSAALLFDQLNEQTDEGRKLNLPGDSKQPQIDPT